MLEIPNVLDRPDESTDNSSELTTTEHHFSEVADIISNKLRLKNLEAESFHTPTTHVYSQDGKMFAFHQVEIIPRSVLDIIPEDDPFNILREHQLSLIEAIINAVDFDINNPKQAKKLWQVIEGTGSGKTFTVPYIIEKLRRKFGFSVFGYGTPRIHLANNSALTIFKGLDRIGVVNDYRMIIVHSGNDIPSEMNGDYGNFIFKSNDADEILAFHNDCISNNKNVIYAVLYPSARKLGRILNSKNIRIDYTLCDEAHNISINNEFLETFGELANPKKQKLVLNIKSKISRWVAKGKVLQHKVLSFEERRAEKNHISKKLHEYKNAKKTLYNNNTMLRNNNFPSDNVLFMTATPTGKFRGETSMSNNKIFGDIIHKTLFSDLASNGLVISNKELMIIQRETDDDLNAELCSLREDRARSINQKMNTVIKGLNDIEKNIKSSEDVKCSIYTARIDEIEAMTGELLRPNSDYTDVESYAKSIKLSSTAFKRHLKLHTTRDYTLIAFGGSRIETMSVEERERKMKEFIETDNALLISCEMLGEGIDIPEINSQIVLKYLNSIEFSQVIGRAARLSKKDQERINNGLLQPNGEYSGYSKDKNLLYILNPHETKDGENLKKRFANMRTTFINCNKAEFIETNATHDLDRVHSNIIVNHSMDMNSLVTFLNGNEELLRQELEHHNSVVIEHVKSKEERKRIDDAQDDYDNITPDDEI